MADHILHPLPFRQHKLLLPGTIAVALVLLLATILGIRTFTSHSSSGTQKMNQNPPVTQPSTSNVLAVITNSGSTNLPGLTLTIHTDGSGSLHYDKGKNQPKNGGDRTFPGGTFDTARLAALLKQIHDVSIVPNHSCLKSISFGTTTTITYNGKTSGDLSCLTKQDGETFEQLRNIVQEAYNKLVHTHL